MGVLSRGPLDSWVKIRQGPLGLWKTYLEVLLTLGNLTPGVFGPLESYPKNVWPLQILPRGSLDPWKSYAKSPGNISCTPGNFIQGLSRPLEKISYVVRGWRVKWEGGERASSREAGMEATISRENQIKHWMDHLAAAAGGFSITDKKKSTGNSCIKTALLISI